MEVFTTVAALRRYRSGLPTAQKVGFVPTMGALHPGHLSLIELAAQHSDEVGVSIFVNPTQFLPGENYRNYPRDLDGDLQKLAQTPCRWAFCPDVEEMYPGGADTRVDPGIIGTLYEGAFRPGHFTGVATVVMRLFQIVQPCVALFGQKDAQQVAVLRRLTRDLHFPVEFLIGPTIRESDGLAMSSRNACLTADQRTKAAVLHRALKAAEARILAGEKNAERVREAMRSVFAEVAEFSLDYGDIVSPESFERLTEIRGKILLIIAGRIGSVRLIDNLSVSLGP